MDKKEDRRDDGLGPGEARRKRLRTAQDIVRKYVGDDVSLVDELISERRHAGE